MRILQVVPFYFPVERGGERHVRKVSEHLVARGHQVDVLTTSLSGLPGSQSRDELPLTENIGGVSVTRIPVDAGPFGRALAAAEQMRGGHRSLRFLFGAGGLAMMLGEPRNFGFVRAIRRTTADLVVSWNWYYPVAYHAYLARRLRRFKLIGVPFFHTADDWVHRPIYRSMLAQLDGFIGNTTHERDFALERAPNIRRATGIGAGIDPAGFPKADGPRFRARHGLGDAPLVGFVGSIGKQKGADTLVQAMTTVWQTNPRARLIMAGYPSQDFPLIDAMRDALGPERRGRIQFLPNFPEEEKADLYDAIDVFALPSTGDSFGIVYLEAWHARKPVIGCGVQSIACVIDDGVDGLLVPPRDPISLCNAITALLADPDRRAAMGARGYQKTMTRYTWSTIGERFESFCQTVLEDR
jgi:glycosyltransferase involved in cell wall biosynthesis